MDIFKQKGSLIKAGYWLMVGLGAYLCLRFVLPCLLPFLTGFAVAFLLRPVVSFLRRHSGIGRRGASIVTAIAFYIVLGLLLWVAGAWICKWLGEAAQALPELFSRRVAPFITELLRRLETLQRRFVSGHSPEQAQQMLDSVQQVMTGLLSRASTWCMEVVGTAVQGIPAFMLAVLFTVLASVLVSADYEEVSRFIMRQIPQRTHKTLLEVRDFLAGTIWRMLRAYLMIMAITFAILLAGFWILRVEAAVVMAAVIAVLDLLPVIGSGLVLLPWAVYELLGGEIFLGGGLLLLWAVLSIAREVLEPKIVGNQLGLHPLVSLVAMYAGLKLAGFIGLLAAPVLCLLLEYLHKRGVIRLFRSA